MNPHSKKPAIPSPQRSYIRKRDKQQAMEANSDVNAVGVVAKRYEATDKERSELKCILERRKSKPIAPRLKFTRNKDCVAINVDHADLAIGWTFLMNSMGSDNADFAEGLAYQITNATTQGQNTDGKGPNFALAVIQGIGPQDQIEAMLAAQMAAVHIATMTFARRLAHVETLDQQDSASTAFNKLARTFAVQVEALKRYRTGGEQKVTVQHVTVNEGGQAIVGAVSQTQGGAGHGGKA